MPKQQRYIRVEDETYKKTGKHGRPTAYTTEKGKEICDIVRAGNYMETAAAHAGISKNTLFDWLRRGARGEEPYSEFSVLMRKSLSESEQTAVQAIVNAARSGAWQAAAWYLERKNWKRWGRKDKITAEIDSKHTERTEQVIEQQITTDPETRELLRQLYERQQSIAQPSVRYDIDNDTDTEIDDDTEFDDFE